MTCTSGRCHWTGTINGEQHPDVSRMMNEDYEFDKADGRLQS